MSEALLFRAVRQNLLLIANPDVADEYSRLKKRIAKTCNNDIELYCDGKDAFVKEHEKKALEQS